jgi:hypothetical protein
MVTINLFGRQPDVLELSPPPPESDYNPDKFARAA